MSRTTPDSQLGRPFKTLTVRPFLFADAAALRELQTQFHKLSRLYHPDRFINATDEDRAEAEARSAELNADYARLRDTWALIDAVLNPNEQDVAGAPAKSSAPPPELAEEYFDLQEAWMEGEREKARAQAQSFLERIQSERRAGEEAVLAMARKFPYAGAGEGPTPWTHEDLERLRTLVYKVRYFTSLERDIRQKFIGA